MKKKYILDTNIFIYEPGCLSLFDEHDLYIAPVTLRELTDLKNKLGEAGYSARRVKRILDELREKGNLKDGLPLGEGKGRLFVTTGLDFSGFEPGMSQTQNDDLILAAAAWMTGHAEEGTDVILVTDDTDMAFFADIIGVKTEHFKNKRAETAYMGRRDVLIPEEFFEIFRDTWKLPAGVFSKYAPNIIPHEFFSVRDTLGRKILAEANAEGETVLPLEKPGMLPLGMTNPWEIHPKNDGQAFLIHALMDQKVPLVIAKGPAGTAKTFITLACGLQQVVNDNVYSQILITRANVEMDATYGFLPGSEEEKVGPMMRPFLDNLAILCEKEGKRKEKDGVMCPSSTDYLFENGFIKAEAMEYMRGRSIKGKFVIIDEAQNCTPNQILAIVSRIGVGSKIVLLGDPEQIDNKLLDKYNCGLTFAADRFIGSGLCAQLTMFQEECVRSPLAAEAAERLK